MANPHVVKALVVDDNPLVRRIHRAMLSGFGFEVTEAKDGKPAVNSFLNGNEYDLVLIDNEMPEMNGVEATKLLKAIKVKAKILAVVDDENSGAMLREVGADAFLTKPIMHAELIAMLRNFNLLN